jgi:hypothetical protein
MILMTTCQRIPRQSYRQVRQRTNGHMAGPDSFECPHDVVLDTNGDGLFRDQRSRADSIKSGQSMEYLLPGPRISGWWDNTTSPVTF